MKPLQNPVVVIILVVAAAALIFRNSLGPLRDRFFSRKPEAVAQPAPAPAPAPALASTDRTEPKAENVPPPTASGTNTPSWKRDAARIEWTKPPRRDPFQYVALPDGYRLVPAPTGGGLGKGVKTAQEMLALKAVWLQTGNKLAVVNGNIVGEGGSILDYKIDKIEHDKVWVSGPLGQERVEFKSVTPTNAPPANPSPQPLSGGLQNQYSPSVSK